MTKKEIRNLLDDCRCCLFNILEKGPWTEGEARDLIVRIEKVLEEEDGEEATP